VVGISEFNDLLSNHIDGNPKCSKSLSGDSIILKDQAH
jgi:hypothetical protein